MRTQDPSFILVKRVALSLTVMILSTLFLYSNGILPLKKEVDSSFIHQLREHNLRTPINFKLLDSLPQNYSFNQPTYIVFWAEWCHVCKEDFASLTQWNPNFFDGYNLIFVSTDTSEQAKKAALELATFWKIQDQTVFDSKKLFKNDLMIDKVPTHILADREGRIAFEWAGKISTRQNEFKKLLQELILESY